jgi:phosphate transport system substrate-binding protein
MKKWNRPLLAALAGIGLSGVAAAQAINAAGATFPYPIYSRWFDAFNKLHSGIEINYQSIGSGGGITQLEEGTVDFAASDRPMTDAEIKACKDKPLHFPTVLGAVVVTYNLPSVKEDLKLTPRVIAAIYMLKITKWNDAQIAKLNPGVKLPHADILVIHRAEGSGTTFIFTDFLSKTSPEWKSAVGADQSPKWPGGLGQKGNEAVAGMVKQTEGAVGYVELAYVLQNHMQSAVVQNAAGQFVKAGLDTVTAAAAGAAKSLPADFRVSITNAPGKSSYPISSFTWLLIPSKIPDPKKRAAITGFLKWMLTDGQKIAPQAPLYYAPLPREVIAKETKQIGEIQ